METSPKKKPLTIVKLCSALARKEGRLSQVAIGDIRELMAILCDMIYEDCKSHPSPEFSDICWTLLINGKNRSFRHRKKSKIKEKKILEGKV